MYTVEEHIDNLVRHIDLVRNACILLGKRLIRDGQKEFGRLVIAKGFEHDVSKFYGIEWDYMHAGPDVEKEKLNLAIHQHTRTNQHHPEYWGGVESMPPIAIAEMTADWYARSQEFGTSLRDWINNTAIERFKISKDSDEYKLIVKYVDILLESSFG